MATKWPIGVDLGCALGAENGGVGHDATTLVLGGPCRYILRLGSGRRTAAPSNRILRRYAESKSYWATGRPDRIMLDPHSGHLGGLAKPLTCESTRTSPPQSRQYETRTKAMLRLWWYTHMIPNAGLEGEPCLPP